MGFRSEKLSDLLPSSGDAELQLCLFQSGTLGCTDNNSSMIPKCSCVTKFAQVQCQTEKNKASVVCSHRAKFTHCLNPEIVSCSKILPQNKGHFNMKISPNHKKQF